MNKKLYKILIFALITAIMFGLGILYKNFVLSNNTENSLFENKVETQADKDKGFDRNKELHKAIEKSAWLESEIRKLVVLNEKEITTKNCSGVLYDQDNDNIYEKSIFSKQFQHNSNVVFHYNFCSFTWNTDRQISLLVTTKNLIEKHMKIGHYGEQLIPTYIYKKSIVGKKKEERIEDNVGLVNLQDIMSY